MLEDVVDPLLDLRVEIALEPPGLGGVARGVELRGERDHAVQPVRPAFVPGAAVVVGAPDPHGLVDVQPEVIQVARERLQSQPQSVIAHPWRSHCAGDCLGRSTMRLD